MEVGPRQQEVRAGIGMGIGFLRGGATYSSPGAEAYDSSVLPFSSEETNSSPTSEGVHPHLQTFSILSRQFLKTWAS